MSFDTNFNIKATIGQVGDRATVSLIYPYDDTATPNVTIATGLTDLNGNFNINPNFNPIENKIYVLQASKRIGSSTKRTISVATYVRYTGSAWESITSPSIKINANTTALTIIDYFDSSISSADTIGKIVNDTITSIGSVSTQVISDVASKASFLIGADTDPTRFISYQNNKYFILKENPFNKNYLVQNKSCPNCDLMYEDLSNINLSSSDLSNANLSNSKLINTNLSNSNITSANLSNSKLNTSNLTNSNLTNSNLTNVNLNSANLSNANITGATLSNTDFSGSTWVNGSTVCLPNSIDKCIFPDFLVNTYTFSEQKRPSLATDSNGNFVVTWFGIGTGDSNGGIFARRFSSDGTPIDTSDFLVNTYTTGLQANPSVAFDSSGNFIITWVGQGTGDTSYGIFARRYSSGSTLNPIDTNEFLINSYTTGVQQSPAVAFNASNGFIVTWSDSGLGDSSGIFARRFNSDRTPIDTNDIIVNTYTTGSQQIPAIAVKPSGEFVITWHGAGNGDSFGVFARRYNSNGTPLDTNQFLVNNFTTNNQQNPSVAIDSTGNFIITWESRITSYDTNVVGKRYSSNATLTPIDTNEFTVNSYTTYHQINPSVATDSSGNFIVAWSGEGNGDTNGIFLRRFNSNPVLTPIDTNDIRVNYYTNTFQNNASVTLDNLGNYTVIWDSYNQESSASSYGVYLHKFSSNGSFIR
ncbi:MAG: pentapeptide repeat-containing protein [Candidatus Sericytochromatia bacterium]